MARTSHAQVRISANTAQFQSAIARVGALMAGLRRRMMALVSPTAGLVTGFLTVAVAYRGLRAAIAEGADLEHLRQETTMTVEELMVFRQTLDDLGIGQEKAARLSGVFSDAIGNARQGYGEYVRSVNSLGIDLDELSQMGRLQQMQTVLAAIGRVEDENVRDALARDFFGRSGIELRRLLETPDAFDDAARTLGTLPAVMARVAVQMERVDTILGRLKTKALQFFTGIMSEVLPAIEGPLERLSAFDFTPIGQRLGAVINGALGAIASGQGLALVILGLEAAFEQVANFARRMLDRALTGSLMGERIVLAIGYLGLRLKEVLTDAFLEPLAILRAEVMKVSTHPGIAVREALVARGEVFGSQVSTRLPLDAEGVARDFGMTMDEVYLIAARARLERGLGDTAAEAEATKQALEALGLDLGESGDALARFKDFLDRFQIRPEDRTQPEQNNAGAGNPASTQGDEEAALSPLGAAAKMVADSLALVGGGGRVQGGGIPTGESLVRIEEEKRSLLMQIRDSNQELLRAWRGALDQDIPNYDLASIIGRKILTPY